MKKKVSTPGDLFLLINHEPQALIDHKNRVIFVKIQSGWSDMSSNQLGQLRLEREIFDGEKR